MFLLISQLLNHSLVLVESIKTRNYRNSAIYPSFMALLVLFFSTDFTECFSLSGVSGPIGETQLYLKNKVEHCIRRLSSGLVISHKGLPEVAGPVIGEYFIWYLSLWTNALFYS